jgi:PAS domain S-box-containing protein
VAFWQSLASGLARFNFFAERNERNFLALAVTGVLFLLPFAVNNFLQGRHLLGVVNTAIVAWFVVHGVAVYRERRLLPPWAVFIPVLATLGYAMAVRGEVGIFWAFPTVLLFHFILERRVANLYNTLVVLLAAAPAYFAFGPDIALRIVVTLVLTIAFANVFSYMGERQRSRELEQEQLLELERDRLALLVHATQAGFTDWDTKHNRVVYSERFKEMLGYPGAFDTSGWRSFFDLMHPEDHARVREVFRGMMRQKRRPGLQPPGEPLEYRLQRARGGHVWVRAASLAQVDAAGRITRFITSFQDISRYHEQAASLRTEQRRLDLVVRASRAGIVDWDGRTHATWYSPRFREMLGHAADTDTSGWPDYFKVMLHPEDRPRVIARFREYILGSGPDGLAEYYKPEEYRLRRADGSYVWVQSMGVCVRDDKGFVTRFIAAITDITERRAQDEALRSAVRLREEVERMSRHDIKTPLNSVIAMARLLREERRLGREDDELLGSIERAGARILSMVNLSLDLVRMEQGSYEFRPDAVDLAEVARRVAADLESQAASKGVAVRVRGEGALALGEEHLCYSMLANLIKNAIEASPDGREVEVTLGERGGALLARVHNAGAVPEEVRPRFFQKYVTAGKSGGVGLGAYSARLLARVQRGDITMRTSAAEGTTLTVRLAPAGGGAKGESVAPPAVGRRVLIVDDDEFNRLVLRRFLPSPAFEVEEAVNGRAALDAARRSWPDAVLLDLEMPVMDGWEFAIRLRSLEREDGRKRCTIVALSSNDEDAVVRRALAAGCDHYHVKPAPRETLLRLLAS